MTGRSKEGAPAAVLATRTTKERGRKEYHQTITMGEGGKEAEGNKEGVFEGD